MDKIQKFLRSLTKRERNFLAQILQDIREGKWQGYDVKLLKGHKGIFRLRKGKIRIVFAKTDHGATLINIGFRKDVYKNL
jgi:mRNA-degrading endonuclease RelE of RelBE toxin-antitoxin system